MKNQTDVKTVIEIYDPAMCCSTGVCGPDVDDTLADFANDIKWLKSQGVEVKRYNLAQEPEAFKMCVPVLTRLQKEGSDVLPIILINGEMVSQGGYPDRATLATWATINVKSEPQAQHHKNGKHNQSVYTDNVDILVAIGASVASGNSTALKQLFERGLNAGISNEDMAKAMQTGINVSQTSISTIVETANELLGVPSNGCTPGGGCC